MVTKKNSSLNRSDPGSHTSSFPQKQAGESTPSISSGYIEQLKKMNEELHQARRAALNLMEDAILSKEALRESESHLAILVESLPIAIGMANKDGKLILSNQEMQQFLPNGMIPSRDIEDGWRWEAWDSSGKPLEKRNFPSARALRGESVVPGIELLYTKGDGTKLWTRISSVPVKNEKGEITRILLSITDIHELISSRKQLKEFNESLEKLVNKRTKELQETSEFLETVLENTSSSIMTLKAIRGNKNKITDLEYIFINLQALKSIDRKTLVGKKMTVEFPEVKKNGLLSKCVEVIEKNVEHQGEVNLSKPGAPLWLQVYAKKLGDGLIISYFDITNRKKAEEEVLRLKLGQQREILNAILIAQEKERERIGEDLHNGIGQLLYAASMKLDLVKASGTVTDAYLADANKILRDAIKDTRSLSFQLVPTVLQDFGLPSAVSTMINRLNSPKTKIKLDIDLTERLSSEMEFSIYRIIQELLNNCIKHADATEIIVRLRSTKKSILAEVKDNGKGFEPGKLDEAQKGIGLQSISNRVKLLQAKMEISSSIGKGTSVRIDINKSPIRRASKIK